MRYQFLILASVLCSGLFVSAEAPSPLAEHRCARLVRTLVPAELVSSWKHLPPEESRARLVSALRRDAADRSRAASRVLRDLGAQEIRVLWGPGVVCAWAEEEAWVAAARLPEVEAVFDDPPRLASEIDDNHGPNPAVPPEAPLISLRVPEAWERGLTGRDVLIAVIDTGVDMTHPDLASQIWINLGEVPGDGIDNDGNGYIDDINGWNFAADSNDPTDPTGHGTQSAGLAAGNGASGKQTGAAPDATLMVLRRGVTEAALWEASQYAVDNGARIITQSTSWKWSFDPDYASWRRQTDVELAAGVIHTNSGGNTGEFPETEPVPYNVAVPAMCPPPWHHPEQSPAAGLSSTLGVGNVDSRSHEIVASSPYGPSEWTDIKANFDPSYPFEMPAEYQDYPVWDGSPGLGKPDLVAPGEASLSTARGGGYATFGGTSAATPRVAGILALMLQAVPDATAAELSEALLTSCRDLGPPGRDNRFGAGLPDAAAALEALGPPLRVVSAELIDPGEPHGDGDSGADEGEIDRLRIVLENRSAAALTGVELILRARTLGRVRDGWALIESIPAGGTGETPDPHLSVEFLEGSCGGTAEMELEIRQGGQARVELLYLPVGSETRTLLLAEDFESAGSFTTSGDAISGGWVRQVPVATSVAGQAANPGEDHTDAPGEIAWVTGNGPADPDAADVDLGTTHLVSPVFDASSFGEVELVYHRWFYGSDSTGEDRYRVEASGDGASWTLVEEISARDNLWRRRRVMLSDLMTPTPTTNLRFSVEDAGGEAGDDTVEGGLDDLQVTGISLACAPWSIPPGSPPDEVGATLRVRRLGADHLELSWDPPSASGGTDPVTGYLVTRSTSPAGGFVEIGRPTQATYTEVDGAHFATGEAFFFLVEPL